MVESSGFSLHAGIAAARPLERAGLLTRDMENAYLAFDPTEEAPINSLIGHSITYRVATGPREGQKVFTLQTLPPDPDRSRANIAESSGFLLHAGVWARSGEREELEDLARYVSRPPVATERLALTDSSHVRYSLKTAYRDGTTHVMLEPEDFIARLSALVPKPRAHLTRYHGIFVPNSALRDRVVARPKGVQGHGALGSTEKTEVHRHQSMTWAKRLKRVFAIDSARFAASPVLSDAAGVAESSGSLRTSRSSRSSIGFWNIWGPPPTHWI